MKLEKKLKETGIDKLVLTNEEIKALNTKIIGDINTLSYFCKNIKQKQYEYCNLQRST